MLEKPDLPDYKIIDALRDHYGLTVAQLTFLPIGADINTVVYRAVTDAGMPYFVKLRKGAFNGIVVEIPKFLRDHDITQVLAALPTVSNALWIPVEDFSLILYPFIDGHNGFEADLAEPHWAELGYALKAMHTLAVPQSLAGRLPRETFSTRWCEVVKRAQADLITTTSTDPLVGQIAALMQAKQGVVDRLIERTEQYVAQLRTQDLEFVLCHTDIHVGNLLIDTTGTLHMIDWDDIKLAPKERDLMYIGSGIGGPWQNDEVRFYEGYGHTDINTDAFAYYRYSRIVEDIGISCQEIMASDDEGENRRYALHLLENQFLPGGVTDIAYRSDNYRPPLPAQE